jgi:hypothetical protein
MTNAPAGWYTDNNDATRQRYWDGEAWGEQTLPVPPPAYPTQATPNSLAPQKTGSLATKAMVFSLCGLVISPLFVVGLIMGIVALTKRNAYGVVEAKGKAITAVVVGALGIILTVSIIIPALSSVTVNSAKTSTAESDAISTATDAVAIGSAANSPATHASLVTAVSETSGVSLSSTTPASGVLTSANIIANGVCVTVSFGGVNAQPSVTGTC